MFSLDATQNIPSIMIIASESLPITEILYLEIDPAKDLKDNNSEAGKLWAGILSLSAESGYGSRTYYIAVSSLDNVCSLSVIHNVIGSLYRRIIF